MPKNTPMLVHNKDTENDKTFFLIPCAEPAAQTYYSGFQGTLTATTITASTDNVSNYALNGKQFVIVRNPLAIADHKCWLSVEAPSGARAISLVLGNTDATGIDAIFGDPGNSGQPAASGDYYDLNGRRLDSKPTRKGVYIQNGRKVVVK